MISPIFLLNFNQKLVKFWEFLEKLPLFWKFSASKTHQKNNCCYCCRMSLLVSSGLQNAKELSDRTQFSNAKPKNNSCNLQMISMFLEAPQNLVFCKSASSPNKFVCSWNFFVKLSNFPANFRQKTSRKFTTSWRPCWNTTRSKRQQPGDGEDHRFDQGNFWRENRKFFDESWFENCRATRSSSTMWARPRRSWIKYSSIRTMRPTS